MDAAVTDERPAAVPEARMDLWDAADRARVPVGELARAVRKQELACKRNRVAAERSPWTRPNSTPG